jgi:hypothetical protein
MSLPGKPRKLPAEYDPRALEQVLQDIYNAMNEGLPYIRLQSLAAEPEKMVAHMVVIANGSTWDPGSGGGMYRRNGSNSAWVFIG